MKLNSFEKILLIATSIIVTLFSLYDVNADSFVWSGGTTLQKIVSVLSAAASFTGVLATLLFQNKGKSAMIWAIINAVLFGSFAFVMNLTADALINILWFIPVVIFNYFYFSKRTRNINHINKRTNLYLIILAIVSFTILYLVVPLLNTLIGKIFNNISTYGSGFKYYWVARIFDTTINTVNIIAMIMMVRGLKGTWKVWMVKNLLAIAFYSGVGFLNISIIVMNIMFVIISWYGIVKWKNKKGEEGMKKAIFVGQGAVGKSTIIKELKKLFKGRDLKVIDERVFLENNETWNAYFGNMKKFAGKMQLEFLEFWTNEMQKLEDSESKVTIMDRHVIETYMFGDLHIKMGNFTPEEVEVWNKKVLESKAVLNNLSKVDYVINISAPIETIEKRISSRAKIESGRVTETNAPDGWWELVNWGYYSKEYGFENKYSYVTDKWVSFENLNSKETALKIFELLK